MEQNGREKRRFKRIKHPLVARIRYGPKGTGPEESSKWNIVTIRNLSVGGVNFNYHQKLELGTVIEFKITLPSSTDPAHCVAEVCRVDELFSNGRKLPIYGIAVFFTELKGESKQALAKLVDMHS